jgi:3-deoxy-D-manno-octulosonic-acid transferase
MIKKNDICALFGSIWPEDLEVVKNTILSSLQKYPKLKIIVAPHENDDRHVKELLNMLKDHNPVLFSDLQSGKSRKNTASAAKIRYSQFRVLIVDTIGDLFFLYENSSIAYVGGGFSTGIHNILEPCAMKNSVIFGPRHHKFPEAKNLISNKCAFSIQNAIEFENIFNDLIINQKKRTKAGSDSYRFITQNTGVSQTLYKEIITLIANNN